MSTMAKMTLSSAAVDFIEDAKHHALIGAPAPDASRVREIIAKSMAKQPLDLAETAVLLRASRPELIEEIFEAARQLKRSVYGNRIVLFAPLYVGNGFSQQGILNWGIFIHPCPLHKTLDAVAAEAAHYVVL